MGASFFRAPSRVQRIPLEPTLEDVFDRKLPMLPVHTAFHFRSHLTPRCLWGPCNVRGVPEAVTFGGKTGYRDRVRRSY